IVETEAGTFLTYLLGAQTTAIVGGEGFDFTGMRAQLDYLISRMQTGMSADTDVGE
ncbi:TetR/AcrR family transcriptional regulator, partial [Burkholderia multivorans]